MHDQNLGQIVKGKKQPNHRPSLTLGSIFLAFTATFLVGVFSDIPPVVAQTREEGILQPGDSSDSTSSNGNLYDEYSFQGQSGQAILITLESMQFDTYLLLINSKGNIIAENDDGKSGSTNSRLAVLLPVDGTYRIWVKAYDQRGQGQYTLTIQTVASSTPEFLAAQANQILQQGRRRLDQQQFEAALESINQSLAIYRRLRDRFGEGDALYAIGDVYYDQSHYAQAIEFYQQALVIRQAIGDRRNEATSLNDLGISYDNLGQYDQALAYYQQALAIRIELGNRAGEGITLNNMGEVYRNLGQYDQALDYYQQALAISQEVGNRAREGTTLNNIGGIYRNLGQYNQALNYYRQALEISREVNDRDGKSTILNNIGLVYDNLGQYDQALNYYRQALEISQEVNDWAKEGITLNNIGLVYCNLRQYDQALNYYQQALAIISEVGDRAGEGATLNNIGGAYDNLEQYDQALNYYQQALVINQEIGDRAGEAITLGHIGSLLAVQQETALAIVFYKHSISHLESIRWDIRGLKKDLQQSYTATIAHIYRQLADLLLQQDRILEAQQVLDLLKVQELDDYLRGIRGNEQTVQGVDLLPQEQEILEDYTALLDRAVLIGQTLTKLRQIQPEDRTEAEQQQIAELVAEQQALSQLFVGFTQRPDVVAWAKQLSQTAREQNLDLSSLRNLSGTLQDLRAQLNVTSPKLLCSLWKQKLR